MGEIMDTEKNLECELRNAVCSILSKYIFVLNAKRDAIMESDIVISDSDDFDPMYLGQLIEYYENRLEYLKIADISVVEKLCDVNHSQILHEKLRTSEMPGMTKSVDQMLMKQSGKNDRYDIYIREQSLLADRLITDVVFSAFNESAVVIESVGGISSLKSDTLRDITMSAMQKPIGKSYLYATICKMQLTKQIKTKIKEQQKQSAEENQ